MHDANVEREEPVPANRSHNGFAERIAAASGMREGAERRRGIWGELALALPPTLTILIVMLVVDSLTHQRLLFASLAASAFLIYYDPMHRMNTVQIMVLGQLIAATLGIGLGAVVGPGYAAGQCVGVASSSSGESVISVRAARCWTSYRHRQQ